MSDLIQYFTWYDIILAVVDITVVAYLFYRVFVLIRGTRAVELLKGIAILLVLVSVTQWLRLYTIHWILSQLRTMLVIAIPVVFQPELRRALEQIGRGKIFARGSLWAPAMTSTKVISEVVEAVSSLSSSKIGALVVLERESGLGEYVEESVKLDAIVSSELLQNIFVPGTPLHDGAVIIRGDRIVAAASFLPFTQERVSVELGSRHRAAIGITEVSDAVSVVVSEETGTISLACGGRLIRGLDKKTLKEKLEELMIPSVPSLLQKIGR
ncbi:MAG: TIGR00159 family protein [Firmicutes bacterium]|nr:TIGR00159 family protein [Candidatus Fermentithermobacillaceae bacterium]